VPGTARRHRIADLMTYIIVVGSVCRVFTVKGTLSTFASIGDFDSP